MRVRYKHFPPLVKIKNAQYHVIFVDKLKCNSAGLCEMNNKFMMIAKDQPNSELLPTMLHEFLHGVEREYGIELGHKIINQLEYDLADLVSELIRRRVG